MHPGAAIDPYRDAAFGDAGPPSAAPRTPRERWLRAVVLGGRGRYAAAATLLTALLADPATPAAVAGHAAVTLASHRRQQGGHAAARRLDALGLRIGAGLRPARIDAGPRVDADPDGTGGAAVVVDALVGLAADAVGLGDPGSARRLLERAEGLGHPSWRLRVRACWVTAELALLCGTADRAVGPAAEAVERSSAAGAARHLLKSRLVRAVVGGVVHPDGPVGTELDAVARAAAAAGMPPLVWPAQLAAADLEPECDPNVTDPSRRANDPIGGTAQESVNGQVSGTARRRHAAAAALSVLYQLSDPVGRRLMGESVGVPAKMPLV